MSPKDSTLKPSPKQVYYIARLALRFAGHELPESRKDAHELIQALIKATEAKSSDDCPF